MDGWRVCMRDLCEGNDGYSGNGHSNLVKTLIVVQVSKSAHTCASMDALFC